MNIQLIEESKKDENNDNINCRVTLLCKPKKDSLEVIKYDKHYVLVSTMFLDVKEHDYKLLIERIRTDAAVEVFTKFYHDNFILNETRKD